MQIMTKRDKEERQKRKMKVTRERYEKSITVREIKIKVRKSVILGDSMIKTSRGG